MPKLKIAGIDLPTILNKELGGRLSNIGLQLIKLSYGARSSSISGRTVTRTTYDVKGFRDDGERIEDGESLINGTRVKGTNTTFFLLANSISSGTVVPEPDDEIVLDGETFTILRVTSDPTNAQYSCQVK